MFEDLDPFTASPAELLARVVDLEPGPLAMSILLMLDRSRLSPTEAITFLQVHERLTAWWASVQVEAIVAAASPGALIEEFTILEPRADREAERTIRIQDAIREEISAALRLAPTTAQSRIDTARLLAGPLADTARSLALGEISTGHAAVVVDSSRRLPGYLQSEAAVGELPTGDDARAVVLRERAEFEDACRLLQERVLPVARRGTLSMTRQSANRAVMAIDSEGQRRRREQARCTRDVFVVDELDGVSTLIARLATEQAHVIMAAIDATAHLAKDEDGPAGAQAGVDARAQSGVDAGAGRAGHVTMGEYRAQALTDLVVGGATHASSLGGSAGPTGASDPVARAVSVHVDVVMPLDVLTGASDAPVEICGSGGLLGPEALRGLLADPEVALTIRRLVTDPVTGSLRDIGRRSYAVPDRLRDFIVARDRTCRFPGCRRRATRCQIDHATAWNDGGETSAANLGALCQRHHQLKTHAGWDIVRSADDGSCAWVSPQGRHYRHDAPAPVPGPEPPGQSKHRSPLVGAGAAAPDPDPPPF